MSKGLCISEPDTFFPEAGESDKIARAKAICIECPVLVECGAYFKKWSPDYGIWAGKMKPKAERGKGSGGTSTTENTKRKRSQDSRTVPAEVPGGIHHLRSGDAELRSGGGDSSPWWT